MAACLTELPTLSLGKCSATQCHIIQSKDHSYPSSQDRALTQSAHSLVKQQARRASLYVRPCVLASGFHDEARQPAFIHFLGVWVFQQTKRTFCLDSGTLIPLIAPVSEGSQHPRSIPQVLCAPARLHAMASCSMLIFLPSRETSHNRGTQIVTQIIAPALE